MRRKARIDQDSKDWNQSATSFLVCSSILSFISILEFVLRLSLLFPFWSLFSIQFLLISSLTIIVLLLK